MADSPLTKINNVFNNPTLRSVLFNLRFPLSAIGAALLIWKINRAWFWPGFAVSMVGALAQVWCFASLQKNQQLCAEGPYSVVRNPMYLSRFILIFGVFMLLGIILLPPVFSVG